MPARKNNAIDLKIWNPLFPSSNEVQFKNYLAVLDTGNSGRYPTITKKLFNEWKELRIIKNDTSLPKKGISLKSIDNKLFYVKSLKLPKI